MRNNSTLIGLHQALTILQVQKAYRLHVCCSNAKHTVWRESFASENFHKLLCQIFMIKTFVNCGKWQFVGVTGGHANLRSGNCWSRLLCTTWRFGKLLLDKYCLASEREATSLVPTLLLLWRIMARPLTTVDRGYIVLRGGLGNCSWTNTALQARGRQHHWSLRRRCCGE